MTDFFRVCFGIMDFERLGVISGLPGIKYFAAVGLAVLLAAWAYRNREPGGLKPDPQGVKLDPQGVKPDPQGLKPDPQGVAELPRNAIAHNAISFFAGRNRPAKKLFGANNTVTNTVTEALHKRYEMRYKITQNVTPDVTPESRFFNAASKSLTLKAESLTLKAESLTLKAFPPFPLLFLPTTLYILPLPPKKEKYRENGCCSCSYKNCKKKRRERLLDEICPPGNIALREIRGFISRGARHKNRCRLSLRHAEKKQNTAKNRNRITGLEPACYRSFPAS